MNIAEYENTKWLDLIDDIDGLTELSMDIWKNGTDLPQYEYCLLYTSPSPRDLSTSRMPSSA